MTPPTPTSSASASAATDSPPAGIPTAGARRRRYALQTGVLLLAVTFACIFLGVIASSRRVRAQIDLTGSGEHRLSERTRGILADLDATYDVVIAGDMSSVDPMGRRRTADVLDAMGRETERVRIRSIDTSSSAGMREFDALMADLAKAHKNDTDAQVRTLTSAIETSGRLAEALQNQSEQMLDVKAGVLSMDETGENLRRLLESDAARCRIIAETLNRSSRLAKAALEQRIAGTEIPAIDTAATELEASLNSAGTDLTGIARRADELTRLSEVPVDARDRLKPIAASLRSLRETTDTAADSVSRLQVLPIVAVARTLERTSAALVIGPPRAGSGAGGSIRAIPFEELFPGRRVDAQGTGAPVLDLRTRAEELISTALVALGPAGERAPIVVITHDMPLRLGPAFQPFTALVSRLRLRGMEVLEWPTALDADPPALTKLDPGGKRPVVYVTLPRTVTSAESAVQMKRLADAQNRLVGDGRAVLISMNVSTRPATRDVDPLAECLIPLGVSADTGRPILRQVQGPKGRVVTADHFTTETVGGATEEGHLIARAVHGLRCHFPWPVAITQAEGATDTKFTPIIQIRDADAWGESEWLPFAQVRAEERALIANPPSKDSASDDGAGAWTLAAAVEATRKGTKQRAVVVGCTPWFLDDATQVQLGVVDGCPVYRAPGNMELFEASIYWLAGQDQLIARSATAESIPLIPALGEGQMRLIRWMLIAGLPVVVLLIGAGWRLLRG